MYINPELWRNSIICITGLIHMCHMTHSHVSQCVTWLISTRHRMTYSNVPRTWLIHLCQMTHLYVSHDSFVCVTWLIHMCHMTHSYVSQCVTWLIPTRHRTHSNVPRTWLIQMCHMTHSYVSHDSFLCVTWITWQDPCVPQRTRAHATPSCPCGTWLIHMYVAWLMRTSEDTRLRETFMSMCDMTHSYVCDMTHAYLRGHALSRHLHIHERCVRRMSGFDWMMSDWMKWGGYD